MMIIWRIRVKIIRTVLCGTVCHSCAQWYTHSWTVFGRPFVKRFALYYRSIVCLSVLSVCVVDVLWPNGWMYQEQTWHGGRPQPSPHCVRWKTKIPRNRGTALHFSAHVYCGQTAGWIKIKVGLGSGHIVSHGDRTSRKGHTQPPIFGPCLLQPNGWMDQDATWYAGRPWSRWHCVRWGTQILLKRDTSPHFSVHVYYGQMIAHLSYCWALVIVIQPLPFTALNILCWCWLYARKGNRPIKMCAAYLSSTSQMWTLQQTHNPGFNWCRKPA